MMQRSQLRFAPHALSAPAITQALQGLRGWTVNGNALHTIERNYIFNDFTEAMAFVNAVAPICETMQHHPCWVNVYNRLAVKLTTHDAGNMVTQKDIDLAKAMNAVFEKMKQ